MIISGKVGALFVLGAVACSQSSTIQQSLTIAPSQLTGNSVLTAVIAPGSDGSIAVPYSGRFSAPADLSLSTQVDNQPGRFIVILSYDENLAGITPIVAASVDPASEFVVPTPKEIFYTELNSGKVFRLASADDPNLESFTAFAGMIHVRLSDLAAVPTATPTNTPTPTPVPTITVDSFYGGYTSTAVIHDGHHDNPGGRTASTWASGDSAVDHTIDFTFPYAVALKDFTIWWAYNASKALMMTACDVEIQVWDGAAFVPMSPGVSLVSGCTLTTNDDHTSVSFPPMSSTAWRLRMPAGHGHPSYPDIFWVTEVEYTFN